MGGGEERGKPVEKIYPGWVFFLSFGTSSAITKNGPTWNNTRSLSHLPPYGEPQGLLCYFLNLFEKNISFMGWGWEWKGGQGAIPPPSIFYYFFFLSIVCCW